MTVERTNAASRWPAIEFPAAFPQLNGHEPAWVQAVCKGLKHKPYLLVCRSGHAITGILPLIYVRSLLFGRFLVSLPYLNTGGPWATDQAAAVELITDACDLADELDVRYLELRCESPVDHPKLNASRTDKVHMRLALPESDELLNKSFKSKLRSQIKKSHEHNLSVTWGQHEALNHFYDVFAVNMRDLGTPVFSRNLFAEILTAFDGQAELCIVSQAGKPVAGGLLVHNRGITEVPSASSLREFNHTGANMWMYRHLLARAIERGSHTFDFGRSSLDSGTYRFKEQWGAKPFASHWQYYVRHGSAEDMRPDSGGKARLVKLWRQLPVFLTRLFGPWIVRGIP